MLEVGRVIPLWSLVVAAREIDFDLVSGLSRSLDEGSYVEAPELHQAVEEEETLKHCLHICGEPVGVTARAPKSL